MMRRAVWLACVCLVLTASSAFASAPVVGDFDGDGQRDRATLSRHEPSVLRVWLSTTNTIAILHAGSPILAMAARDLDGDHRDELIASDASGLHVWTSRRGKFATLHPRRGLPPGLARDAGHSVDDGPSQCPGAVPSGGTMLLPLASASRAYRPWCVSIRPSTGPAVAGGLPAVHAPFAPRPPPPVL